MALPFTKRLEKHEPVDPASADHVFDAVPEAAPGVEAAEDSSARLQLRLKLRHRPGLTGIVARALHFRPAVRVNLDERGTLFWQLIDGRRTLRDIEKTVRERWQVDEKESRQAVVLFTKMLMTRHLMNLRVARRDMSGAHQPTGGL